MIITISSCHHKKICSPSGTVVQVFPDSIWICHVQFHVNSVLFFFFRVTFRLVRFQIDSFICLQLLKRNCAIFLTEIRAALTWGAKHSIKITKWSFRSRVKMSCTKGIHISVKEWYSIVQLAPLTLEAFINVSLRMFNITDIHLVRTHGTKVLVNLFLFEMMSFLRCSWIMNILLLRVKSCWHSKYLWTSAVFSVHMEIHVLSNWSRT